VELLAKLKSILGNCETLMDTKPEVICCIYHISHLQCDWEVVIFTSVRKNVWVIFVWIFSKRIFEFSDKLPARENLLGLFSS